MHRHGEALVRARGAVDRRGRRGMEGGAAQPANHEQHAERHGRGGKADQAQHHHRQDRPGDEQQARAPAVGQRAEGQLRHRRGHLEAHGQRADGGEREAQVRDEERQQRRVDVGVGVDDEVRGGQRHDRGRQPQEAAGRGARNAPGDGIARCHDVGPIRVVYTPPRCGPGPPRPDRARRRGRVMMTRDHAAAPDRPCRRHRAVPRGSRPRRRRRPAPPPASRSSCATPCGICTCWYRELPDADPARYGSPEAYLEAVRYRPLDQLVQLHHLARRQRRVLFGEPVHRPRPVDDRDRRRAARAAGVCRQSRRGGRSRAGRPHHEPRRPGGERAHRERRDRHGLRPGAGGRRGDDRIRAAERRPPPGGRAPSAP